MTILGVGESPSEGLRKGVVVNLEKTISSIQAATVMAERMAGQRIESVVVSLGGTHLWSQNSTGVVAVAHPDHEIGEDDVHRVVEASRAISVASDRQVVHVIQVMHLAGQVTAQRQGERADDGSERFRSAPLDVGEEGIDVQRLAHEPVPQSRNYLPQIGDVSPKNESK